MAIHQEEIEPSGFEGRGGALVEEAKRLMQDDEDTVPRTEEENGGKKIKMNRIGRKPKKGASTADNKGASQKTAGADKG